MVVEVMEVVMEVIVGEMIMAMPLAAAPTRTAVPAAASGEMPTANWTGEVTTTHVAATETATHVAATTAEASAATAVSSVRLLHGGRSNKQAACKSSNCNKYSRFMMSLLSYALACPGQADFLRCQSERKKQVALGTRVKNLVISVGGRCLS
jgi:hypothetical protein